MKLVVRALVVVAVLGAGAAWALGRPHVIETRRRVHATPAQVWDVLTDFAAYPEWNPVLVRVSGHARPGATLDVRLQPEGAKGAEFPVEVQVVDPDRELRWVGRFAVPGLFEGTHAVIIDDLGDGTVEVIQREGFRGVLIPLLRASLESQTRPAFEATNDALAARVASLAMPGADLR